jgi:hypothetical protein
LNKEKSNPFFSSRAEHVNPIRPISHPHPRAHDGTLASSRLPFPQSPTHRAGRRSKSHWSDSAPTQSLRWPLTPTRHRSVQDFLGQGSLSRAPAPYQPLPQSHHVVGPCCGHPTTPLGQRGSRQHFTPTGSFPKLTLPAQPLDVPHELCSPHATSHPPRP